MAIDRLPSIETKQCDKCPAMAKVIALFLSGELFFCGHHAKLFADTLTKKALSIYDPDNYLEKVTK